MTFVDYETQVCNETIMFNITIKLILKAIIARLN